MASKTRYATGALIGVAILAASGCGGSDQVEVYPVKGKVTFEGQPMVGGGSIMFMPTGGQAGKAAGGTIDKDGNYVLTTYDEGDGSMEGEFRVIITQTTVDEPPTNIDSDAGGSAGNIEPVIVVQEADRIPAIYGDPGNSPLTTKVEAKDNELDFDLKRQVGEQPVQRGA